MWFRLIAFDLGKTKWKEMTEVWLFKKLEQTLWLKQDLLKQVSSKLQQIRVLSWPRWWANWDNNLRFLEITNTKLNLKCNIHLRAVLRARPFSYDLCVMYLVIILNDQLQVFRFLYAIWPKSKDLYPTYLKATQPPSNLRTHQVSIKFARLACI